MKQPTPYKLDRSNFFEAVYAIVREIPKGRVTSYGAIAAALGAKSSSRMVGYAMNNAHSLKDVPAHRVVNHKGLLTGKFHFKTLTTMENLLKKEGVIVEEDKVVDFKNKFWDPASLLDVGF